MALQDRIINAERIVNELLEELEEKTRFEDMSTLLDISEDEVNLLDSRVRALETQTTLIENLVTRIQEQNLVPSTEQ